ncbi:hypothetical protein ACFLWY_03235 [Chloroflexota bacterium]
MKKTLIILSVVLIGATLGLSYTGCVHQEEPEDTQLPKIVSVSGEIGEYTEIFIMNADGSNRTNLTNHPATDSSPRCSPDGKSIAFSSMRGDNYDIYTMDINGENLTRLTDDTVDDYRPVWSPDGKKIAFTHGYGGVYITDADGSNTVCPTGWGHGYNLSWSPDGKKIACDDGWGIWVGEVGSERASNLTSNREYRDGYPAWSPDGSKIAFASMRDGHYEIYLMDADGGNQARLTDLANVEDIKEGNKAPLPDTGCPSWSPDGKRIAFVPLWSSMSSIYTIDADGSNQTRFFAPEKYFMCVLPSWSPDGQKILFNGSNMAKREGMGVYVVDAAGNEPVRLTPSNTFDRLPRWCLCN